MMTDKELAAIVERKEIERYRRGLIAYRRRRAYEKEHDGRLREAIGFKEWYGG